MFDAADLAVFYSPDMPAYETVTFGGNSFGGFFRSADATNWESPRVGTHTLRYLDTTTLAAGDLLTIATVAYKVIGKPIRINATEYSADLVAP